MENTYSVKQATYPFSCPRCGSQVNKGKNYVDDNGVATCMCVLGGELPSSPSATSLDVQRRLLRIPFKRESLEFENLRMRLELEQIAENPEGRAAKKIIAKYRMKMEARKEQRLSKQN